MADINGEYKGEAESLSQEMTVSHIMHILY